MECEKFADKNDLIFLEVSAKSGFNIDKLFNVSSDLILKQINENKIDFDDKVNTRYSFFFYFKYSIKKLVFRNKKMG